jgi:hypothetical protein
VNLKNERGDALVHLLIYLRRREFWHVMWTSKKTVDYLQKNGAGKTPKQLATELGWTDVASRLPER